MSKQKSMKAYYMKLFPLSAFICRGKCIDTYTNKRRVSPDVIDDVILYYDEDLDLNKVYTSVYGVYHEPEAGHIALYAKYADAVHHAANCGEKCKVKDVKLFTSIIDDPSQPIPVTILHGDDGRLYAKINLHPSHDGMKAIGKTFFPDRSWTEVCDGPATVTIMKEMQAYGFLTGTMQRFDTNCPKWDDLLDFVWKDDSWIERTVARISHPIRGNYIAVRHYGGWDYVSVGDDGRYYTTTESCIADDLRKPEYVELEATTFLDIFLSDTFGKTAADIISEFTTCKWLSEYVQRSALVGGEWEEDTSTNPSDIVQAGIDQHLIKQYVLTPGDVQAIELSNLNMKELLVFTKDELDSMFEEVADINRKAEKDIANLVRRGRLKIRGLN